LQGIVTQVVIELPGIWTDSSGDDLPGRVSLYIPIAGDTYDGPYQFGKPFLHWIADEDRPVSGVVDLFTMGVILAEGLGAHAMEQGVSRGGYLFEYEEDAARYTGGHILIRSTSNPESWWHYHDRRLRLASKAIYDSEGITGYEDAGIWRITLAGSVQTVNLAPIQYGTYDGWAMADVPKPLPDSGELENVTPTPWAVSVPAFGYVATVPDGWTVTAGQDPGGARRPYITFARGGYSDVAERPVLWFATEQHDATIGAAVAGRESTEDTDTLEALSWSWGKDWKGSQGVAQFFGTGEEQFAGWRENGNVRLSLGWQSGAGAGIEKAEIAEAYIMPGGLPRARDGQELIGTPTLQQVQLGAFDVARLPQKQLYDVRQAGGMTVAVWAAMIGNRLGIPAARITVDAGVSSRVIAMGDPPSKPSLAVQDGDDAAAHIAAVERAAGIRVCWDRDPDYTMWVDGGAPDYDPGTSTIALEIDAATLDAEDVTWRIVHQQSLDGLRNVLKAIYGPDGAYEFYWSETEAERAAGLGDDWGAVIVDQDALDDDTLLAQFERQFYRWPSVITWMMPLRIDLLPDLFVQVSNCAGVQIVDDSVYRISTVAHAGTADDGQTECVAELVWVPEA
jgi:hypothetical protein